VVNPINHPEASDIFDFKPTPQLITREGVSRLTGPILQGAEKPLELLPLGAAQ